MEENSIPVYEVSNKLQNILDKVADQDTLTSQEKQLWLQHFAYVISDGYTLTTENLLSSHDWWLKCLEYKSGIVDSKMTQFETLLPELRELELTDFINFITTFFTIEELASVDINELA